MMVVLVLGRACKIAPAMAMGVRSFVKNKVPITKLYSRGNKKITDSTDSQGSDMGWLRR